MSKLSVNLLGSFQVTLDSEPVSGFEYDKVRALLAYLAVEAESAHRREALATLLWPDQTPKRARHSLRQSLSTLRRAINDQQASPPFLLVEGDTIQFNHASHTWLDVDVLQTHLAASDHAHLNVESCQPCIQHLDKAVVLYRGDFLQGLLLGNSEEFENWVMIRRERLRAQVLTALHYITRHYLHRGKYTQAQTYALRQVELEPYREEAHRQLMHILARSGQRSAALAQYETCRRILVEELGVEPTQETHALYKRIRSAGEARSHNLPSQSSALIGREGELQQIAERLADPNCRLLTVTGLGGIGKTRLALQAAQEHIGVYLHGVFFVPLASLNSVELLVPTILSTLPAALGGAGDSKDQLLDYVREKDLLLVLDNFEHLLAGTDLIEDILRAAPDVKILVTSRDRLRLQEEWLFDLQGLTCPQVAPQITLETIPACAAVQLFEHRARRVAANFVPSHKDYEHIARICQLLQGTPLGIELAAGWVRLSSCQDIAAEIEANLDFLITDLRNVPDRHKSLRAVFEYSWRLLSATEQSVARKLAIFQAGFRLEVAQQVAGATPSVLADLVDKSFLSRDQTERYEQHPLVKQYLVEKLTSQPAERAEAQQAHSSYFAHWAHHYQPALVIESQLDALVAMGTEIDNLRAAWQWAVQQARFDLIELMSESMSYFYWMRNWFCEGREAFEQATAAISKSKDSKHNRLLLAKLQIHLAEFYAWLGDLEHARELVAKNVAQLRQMQSPSKLAYALEIMGLILYWQCSYSQARQFLQEAIDLYRQTSQWHGLASALNLLSNVVCDESADYAQAQRLLSESLTIYQDISNQFGIAKVLINQGVIYYTLEDYQTAKPLLQESLRLYRQLNYPYGISAALNNLSMVARAMGELVEAKALAEEGLFIKQEIGNRQGVAHALLELGNINQAQESYTEAWQNYTQALQLAQAIRVPHLMLHMIIGHAELYQRVKKTGQALKLLAFVLKQSNGAQELENQAQGLFAKFAAGLAPQQVSACETQGRTSSLDTVVSELLEDKATFSRP